MPIDRKTSLTDEIADLDRRLLTLLAQRTRLLTKAAAGRRAKGKGAVDPTQERRMRAAWDEAAAASGLSRASLRAMFTMLNGLAYDAADRPEAAAKAGQEFSLKPKAGPVSIDAVGLASVRHACLLAAIAAASGQETRISPAPLCDPLIELVKAFNQLGGMLSWEEEAIVAQRAEDQDDQPWALTYEGTSVFAGQYPLNLYLLLAFGLGQAGRTSLSGAVELKLLDLGPLAPILAALGARLAPVTPNTRGLPSRLEAGERMATSLALPDDCPPDFAAALATAAWSYPEGLSLRFTPGSAVASALASAVTVLTLCGVSAVLADGEVRIPHATPTVPQRPTLPMEPLMAAAVLSMPQLRGGSARLYGALPLEVPAARDLPALLRACGVNLEVRESGRLNALPGDWPRPLALSVAEPALAPLAVALAAACPHGATLEFAVPPHAQDELLTLAREMLFASGKGHHAEELPAGGRRLMLDPGFAHDPQHVYVAPAPEWALGIALLALARPGLALDNPGELTGLWPGFWAIYNRLSAPVTSLTPPKKDAPTDDKPRKKGRRIVVS